MKIKDSMLVPGLAMTAPEMYNVRIMFDTENAFRSPRDVCNNGIMYRDRTTDSNRWLVAGGREAVAKIHK